jgi:hypothetical protein
MHKRIKTALLISLAIVLALSACSSKETDEWKIFSIDQEPAFDIQFRLPPGWLVDYAPNRTKPGQWDVTLVPPKCTSVQEIEYQQNCITLIAHIKGISTFSKEAFLDLMGGDITLSQDGTQTALFLGQESFRVNRLKVDRYNHLIATALGEVQMSAYYFETDGAYFTFITNFPYSEAENEAIDNFELLLGSVKKTR